MSSVAADSLALSLESKLGDLLLCNLTVAASHKAAV